jgi:bacillithiol system protein YtxJ
MKWNELNNISQLDEINTAPKNEKIMIFKHSTRCSISSSALNRIERNWNNDTVKIKPYYLDLIAHRDISNKIIQQWNIEHQSPQILVIENGICTYNNSHMGIDYNELMEL